MNHYQPLLLSFDEATALRNHFQSPDSANSLISRSIAADIKALHAAIKRPVEIPGQGEAGGYEHTCHKQNGLRLHLAGRLWLITRDQAYGDYVIELLTGYADIYPALALNTSRDTNPPGRLFHQTLNENMWLVSAADAYSCVYQRLEAQQRRHIEGRLFREMAQLFTDTYSGDFDILHNHGLWSVAAVGLCGYAIDDQSMVDKALYGLKGDAVSGGFLAQLGQLFSPDGYYMEGPYYHRFAIRPLLLFAEAIARRQPELDIYQVNNGMIKRACYGLMATAFPDGTLPALNDSSKTMSIRDEGVVLATSICFQRYGADPLLIAMAHQQQRVWVSAAGLSLSAAAQREEPKPLNWGSRLLRDGADGNRGGLGILRQQDNGGDMHMALMWFGQHGSDSKLHAALDHGHFDGLHISWFNRGQEVLKDYGFGRWINIEPKFGGRYIPENKSYCKQTIAHNTVVVDETSQNNGDTASAERRWGQLHFMETDTPAGQGVSAFARGYYAGVALQRTLLMLSIDGIAAPVLLDLFRLVSDKPHQYDYALHYSGQIIRTDFDYHTHARLSPLGAAHGYQHLWELGRGRIAAEQGSGLVSWLTGNSYYSMVTALPCGGDIIFLRTGANDPCFNLRSEPALIVRTRNANQLFATAIETHGYFDEATETSREASGDIEGVEVVGHNSIASVVRLHRKSGSPVTVMVSNEENPAGDHAVEFSGRHYAWAGAFATENCS